MKRRSDYWRQKRREQQSNAAFYQIYSKIREHDPVRSALEEESHRDLSSDSEETRGAALSSDTDDR